MCLLLRWGCALLLSSVFLGPVFRRHLELLALPANRTNDMQDTLAYRALGVWYFRHQHLDDIMFGRHRVASSCCMSAACFAESGGVAARRLASKFSDVPGRTEVSSIMVATTLFACLGLPDKEATPETVKRCYRQLAITIHPDKCKVPGATVAFQKISEAFEQLSSLLGQRKYLKSLAARSDTGDIQVPGRHVPGLQRTTTASPRPSAASWWKTKTWAEFDARWKNREAAEAALQQSFRTRKSETHQLRSLRQSITLAERLVRTRDVQVRIAETDLWPPAGLPDQDPDANRPELDNIEFATQRLVKLVEYLRCQHLFCFWSGHYFEDQEDLRINCPGLTMDDHDNANQKCAPEKIKYLERCKRIFVKSRNLVAATDEPDALDDYMKQLENGQTELQQNGPKKKMRYRDDVPRPALTSMG
eukprot:gnl/TRDRNA2_/TRDRNA2_202573_c0_seq1.p1 gnl/TRDRNA2_/TRDRNA2_202573_c0~~gnl/TRDRNA2_/TRDRNA2_202573_c0_seq1.p1  ORF type:complete len:419 (+),score=46.32 gnl/TRDRNA2_/TRDRNA2_202573_c0_seq1:91-1347(+)